jgi:hypothetical protein
VSLRYTARQMRRRSSAFTLPWHPVAAVLSLILTVGGVTSPRAWADEVRVHGEVGGEYDDNVHWVGTSDTPGEPPPTGSALARAVLGVTTAARLSARQDVAFSVLGAAKLFEKTEARSENLAVVETSGSWRVAVADRTRLSLNGGYYEAIQAGTAAERYLSGVARDFRSLSPTLRIARAMGPSSSLAFASGYRWFVYKPLPAYDFDAPVLTVEYQYTHETLDGAAEWDATAAAGVELRNFRGTRLVPQSPCPAAPCTAVPDPRGDGHTDQFVGGRLDITRTGRMLVGGGYSLQWNRSNSYSETLLRHAATVRLTAPLPFGLYLAARAEVVLVLYPDRAAFPAGPSGQLLATIEDENRTQLRAELSRDLTRRLQLVLRYSLYVNAIGQNSYQRQTSTLALAFSLD